MFQFLAFFAKKTKYSHWFRECLTDIRSHLLPIYLDDSFCSLSSLFLLNTFTCWLFFFAVDSESSVKVIHTFVCRVWSSHLFSHLFHCHVFCKHLFFSFLSDTCKHTWPNFGDNCRLLSLVDLNHCFSICRFCTFVLMSSTFTLICSSYAFMTN